MIKGLVKHIYGVSARPLKDDADLAGTVYLWLRAGYAGHSIRPITEKLGPWGIDIDDFIIQFDMRSRSISGAIVPVVVRIFQDGSYDFEFGRVSRVKPPLLPEAMDPYQHS